MRSTSHRWLVLTLALLLTAAPAAARKKKGGGGPAEEPGADAKPTLSETVKDMEALQGLVNLYRSDEKLLLELPAELVGAPLGFSAIRVNAVGDFAPRGGSIDNQLVTWKQDGDFLILSKRKTDFRASSGAALAAAVDRSFPDSPVFLGKLIPLGDDPAPLLVEATELFSPALAQILPSRVGYSTSPRDSVLVSVRAFPDNIVARVLYRFDRERGAGGGAGGGNPFARFAGPGRLPDPRRLEVIVDYHLFRLPDDGYRPRQADERIGTFVMPYKDYTGVSHRDTAFRHLSIRWDVRKADPAAEVSDVVEPITFYIDASVPEEWRELLRESALWWNTAFEKVGLRDALRILDPPDDPDWDPADIRHSMIYWNLSDSLVFSGMAGPSVFDPRTGKVLKANVYLNGEFFSYALHRYLVYAWWRAPSPLASGAPQAPAAELTAAAGLPYFCDRVASFSSQMAFARMALESRGLLQPGTAEGERFAREAFAELVSHELGHALGFPHNWKASLASSWDDFVAGRLDGRVGPGIFSSSVMDYNPIYLAPKGKPQGDFFLKELGPYDDLAVEFLYRPLDHVSVEEEARILDEIASRAEVEPGLIYDSGALGDIDPTTNSDDITDDPLAFAESRLVMLREEVLPRLAELVLDEGHDYSALREALDSAVFSIALDYIDMTARHVGGQILLRRVADSPASPAGGAPPITPVAADVQRRALEVLDLHVFATGAFDLDASTMRLLKADLLFDWNYPWRFASDYDLAGRIAGLYTAALSTLLEPARLTRVLQNERMETDAPLTLPELFGHLQKSAFSAPAAHGAAATADRRSLQRALVRQLLSLTVEPDDGVPAEASQVAALTLRSIADGIREELADPEDLDGYARAHLEDLASRIRRNLEAAVALTPGA